MRFHQSGASLYVPDLVPVDEALQRTTHLGIGAHHDDLEIMALHGIGECYQRPDRWFGGVTCTDGAGSPRTGVMADMSNKGMQIIRAEEQRAAARIGRYSFMAQLDYASTTVREGGLDPLVQDLLMLLQAVQPKVVYTHNPADKHPTHIVVLNAALEAMRQLPVAQRPGLVMGCEVWRDLDWLCADDRIELDVSGYESLGRSLIEVFVSQISGGKHYDRAIIGRRHAHATFGEAHAVDLLSSVTLAMDLTPLIQENPPNLADFVHQKIHRFRSEVLQTLASTTGTEK
jgi:LmbE family N-acetylglucosaminyl deacetylase